MAERGHIRDKTWSDRMSRAIRQGHPDTSHAPPPSRSLSLHHSGGGRGVTGLDVECPHLPCPDTQPIQ
ncbi:hypothetical protein KIPB_017282, partial [Kipferlia bialata]|eukprot:g17282.t1